MFFPQDTRFKKWTFGLGTLDRARGSSDVNTQTPSKMFPKWLKQCAFYLLKQRHELVTKAVTQVVCFCALFIALWCSKHMLMFSFTFLSLCVASAHAFVIPVDKWIFKVVNLREHSDVYCGFSVIVPLVSFQCAFRLLIAITNMSKRLRNCVFSAGCVRFLV